MLLQSSHFFLPFIPHCPAPLLQPAFPHLSSCLWVIHISSLASLFPILFLTSPCLFCTYHLCFLFPVPFPSFSPLHVCANNLLCDLYFCESVPVLVVCSFIFAFVFFMFVVDSCEFVVILMFIVLTLFYFLDKSL